MLSFVMVTQDDGPDLDAGLRALGAVMAPDDRLIAFDTGSTDHGAARLEAFDAPCDLIRLETGALGWAEAMRLALDLAQTPYLMALQPRDRLCPAPLSALRDHLAAAAPDLAVLQTGWWLCDPEHPMPRTDAARVTALSAPADPAALQGLCPDPRRLVLSRSPWRERSAVFGAGRTASSLYSEMLVQAGSVHVQPGPVLVHPPAPVDPVPLLRDVLREMAALPSAARTARLDARLVWLDEVVMRTPPEAGAALLDAFTLLLRGLARPLRARLRAADGPSGRVAAALHRRGRAETLATIALLAAQENRKRSDHLATDYARLRSDLDLALPGPDYLRALYARLRGP